VGIGDRPAPNCSECRGDIVRHQVIPTKNAGQSLLRDRSQTMLQYQTRHFDGGVTTCTIYNGLLVKWNNTNFMQVSKQGYPLSDGLQEDSSAARASSSRLFRELNVSWSHVAKC